MISFDPSFRAGDLLQVAAFLGVGISAFYNIKGKIKELFLRIEAKVENDNLRFQHIDAALADAKAKLENSQTQDALILQLRREVDQIWSQVKELRDKIEELRHWKGFVNPDGEYRRDITVTTRKPLEPV